MSGYEGRFSPEAQSAAAVLRLANGSLWTGGGCSVTVDARTATLNTTA